MLLPTDGSKFQFLHPTDDYLEKTLKRKYKSSSSQVTKHFEHGAKVY